MLLSLALACASPRCGGPVPDADGLYAPGALPSFSLELDEAALAALPTVPSPAQEDVHATLEIQGASFDVGLKLKGHASFRDITEKASFKLDLGQWVEDQSFLGVRRFTLNNLVQDPSQLAGYVAARLFAALDVPAPRQGYACVAVNGVDHGLYGLVETPDEQLLERLFEDPGGDLWEAGDGADFEGERVFLFEPEEWRSGTRDRLVAFMRAVDQAEPGAWLDLLDAWTDREALLRLWAAEAALGNFDGYSSRTHNYMVYDDPSLGRFRMLPWGVDQALSRELDPFDPAATEDGARMGILFAGCLEDAACREAYADALLVVADTIEEAALDEALDEARALLWNSAAMDARNEHGRASTWSARARAERYLAAAPDRVRGAVAP